jgi:hypothetical protein
MAATYCEPTVLWRLSRARSGEATAVVVPHWHFASLVFFENGAIMSCEDFCSLDDAVMAADDARRRLEGEGCSEAANQVATRGRSAKFGAASSLSSSSRCAG